METAPDKSTERLGSAPLVKLLLSLSLPGMASLITIALYNIIDTFWVARLGHEAIAALTIILPFHIFVIAVGIGTGVGINALVSRSFGEGNIEVTNHTGGQIFFLAALFGAIFLIAAVFFAEPILTVLGATPDIMDYAREYLVIIGFGTPFVFFLLMANNLLRGSGEAIRPMIFMITAQVINIILDPFMILGIGPFTEMGVRGAALATVISQGIGAGLCFYYIVGRKSAFRIKLSHLKPDLSILRGIYRVGSPAIVVDMMESLMFALFNTFLSRFGSLAIAGGGIAIRIADLAFMPIFGAAFGLLPVIGYCFGAGLRTRLWRAVKVASLGMAAIMALATLVFEIFAPQMVAIFGDDPELIALAVPAIRIILSSLSIVGPLILFITVFEGLSKGREVLVLSLIRQLAFFIPAIIILPRLLGTNGVWLSIPVSDSLGFLVAGAWLYREYRRQQGPGSGADTVA